MDCPACGMNCGDTCYQPNDSEGLRDATCYVSRADLDNNGRTKSLQKSLNESQAELLKRRERIIRLEEALQKVLDDSEVGVVPRSHLDCIEYLLKT